MVTGCGCHDPVVFGHGSKCGGQLGPHRAGGKVTSEDIAGAIYGAEYDPAVPPERRTYPSARAIQARDNWLRKIRGG